ncbi:SGNH/GDSL hydrolase family protein [Bradyrhizobium tunisiense]|uniref:SGNH/GDSL hydrolase family protein n=1 Tax=Bradyrhizobium tunisiense TaxID=3278709 RepID=UPI0035E19C2C
MIASHLEQGGHGAIVVIGDSRVESARLPSEVGGRPLVNAGVGGATVGLLENMVLPLISKAYCIVVAVGVNNAKTEATVSEDFLFAFDRLCRAASDKAEKLVVATIPPVAENAPLGVGYYDPSMISTFNDEIRALAGNRQYNLSDIAALMQKDNGNLPSEFSSDGVHLTAAGYAVFIPALLGAT